MHDYKKALIKHEQTCLEKYGVDHYSKTEAFSERMKSLWTPEKLAERAEKTRQSCLKKYGVDNPSKLKSVVEKIKSTKIEKYNDVNYNNRTMAVNTCMAKYGVKHQNQNKELRAKITKTRTEKFIVKIFDGTRFNNVVTPLFKPEDFKTVDDIYLFKCNTCRTEFDSNISDGKIPKCPICFSRNNVSKTEIEFLNYLHILKEDRQKYIKPYKVDGIKNNKIFEFLGDYWHGNPKLFAATNINLSTKTSFGELYTKTLNKFISLKTAGYDIYYIWESSWIKWSKDKNQPLPIKKYKLGELI